MGDGEGGFLDHLTRIINEQHMCKNIVTIIFFPQLFLPQRPFIGELLFVCLFFFFLVQRSLYVLWRGLIRNGPPVCPKHKQPVHKCMQMPLFFCFYFFGWGLFSCVNLIFAGNRAHTNAGVWTQEAERKWQQRWVGFHHRFCISHAHCVCSYVGIQPHISSCEHYQTLCYKKQIQALLL